MASPLVFVLISSWCISTVIGQDCSSALSCDVCIQRHRDCAWCTNLQGNVRTRCLPRSQHDGLMSCTTANIVAPSSVVNVTSGSQQQTTDVPLVDLTQDNRTATITVGLRTGASAVFDVKVRRRSNFPVDLYYLLDTSGSMGFNLLALRANGPNIINRLAELTPNRRLGLGTFNDKPIPPFINNHLDNSIYQPPGENCGLSTGIRTICGIANSFTHALSLTENVTEFAQVINSTLLVNKPQRYPKRGTLDGLLQAAVCQNEVGWSRFVRGDSIRLIVVATDGLFHAAGDGVFGGILRKNDGRCHLDSSGRYDQSAFMDYPSPGQVKDAMDANEILVLFAIAVPDVLDDPTVEYSQIVGDWAGRAQQARLIPGDDERFVDLVFNATRDASELARIQLDGENINGVRLSATATCPSGSPVNPGEQVERCNEMTINMEATFRVTLTAQDCNMLSQVRNLQLYVSPAYGVVNITVDAICTCPCTEASSAFAPSCSNQGNLTCGKCDCPADSPGSNCSCNSAEIVLVSNQEQDCRPPNATAGTALCSGQGVCGVTDSCRFGCPTCSPGFHGQYCQCRDNLCGLAGNGQACGGNTQGRCECDPITCDNCVCACFEPYNLDAVCNLCNQSLAGCRANDRSAVCSNNGECSCGTCNCTGGWTGSTCSACQEGAVCLSEVCGIAAPCVNAPTVCHGGDTCYLCPGESVVTVGELSPGACNKHFCPNIISLDTSPGVSYTFTDPLNPPLFLTEGSQCTTQDGNCRVTFFTASTQSRLVGIAVVKRNEEQDCTQSFNYLPVVLGIVFGLLGLAIVILVVWKIVTFVLDRREYRHFLEAQKNAKWEKVKSPLYKDPIQKFVNPDFKGRAQS